MRRTADVTRPGPDATGLDSNIKCYGVQANAVKNPWLLVPGTGATGPEAYELGYVKLLTNLKYQPCVVSPPRFMLDDLQVEAEYVCVLGLESNDPSR